MTAKDIVIVHSSDLHVDHDYTARMHGGDGTAGLASVLALARGAGADAVVLAGDTFDCHRLPHELLDRTAEVIAASALPVVVLPGNHDPAVADAVYHHGAIGRCRKSARARRETCARPSCSPISTWRSGAGRISTTAT